MQRIDNSTAVSVKPVPGPLGTPGFFTNGNPATAQEATIVDDWWANAVQEEILTVIEQAGLTPDKQNSAQLFEALNLLYQGVGHLDDTFLTIVNYRQWEAPHLTTNTASAYTLTYAIPPGALADGMAHIVEFHVANAANAQLGVNNLGLRTLTYYSVGAWRPLPPNLVGPNQIHRVSYHQLTDTYRLTDWRDTTGDYVPTGRAAPRIGTILGLGQAVSRTTYAGLFAAFGTTYGAGNGTTTFNVPDLRGRAVFGTDQGAGRLGAVLTGVLGSFGGSEQMQYTFTGTAASAAVTGAATISGTAITNGMSVQVYGTTSPPTWGWVGAGPGGTGAADAGHVHTLNLYGAVSGNATVEGSGTITGWTGSSLVTGDTDLRSNMPPGIVANYAICL